MYENIIYWFINVLYGMKHDNIKWKSKNMETIE